MFCNYSRFVKQTLMCRVYVPLTFKNVRRRKNVYNKCKSEKIRKADSAPRNRSENCFLSKLLTTVNCKLFSQNSTILDVTQVLSSPLTTINQCFLQTTKDLFHCFLDWWLLLPTKILQVQSQQ